MAKAQFGPLASYITGSVGDITVRNTRNGPVFQQKPIPTGDPTPAQLARRAAFRRGKEVLFPVRDEIINLWRAGAAEISSNYLAVWQSAWLRLSGPNQTLHIRTQTLGETPPALYMQDFPTFDDFLIDFQPPYGADDFSWLVVGEFVLPDGSIAWIDLDQNQLAVGPTRIFAEYPVIGIQRTLACWIMPLNPARTLYGNGWYGEIQQSTTPEQALAVRSSHSNP